MENVYLELIYKNGDMTTIVFDREKPNAWKDVKNEGIVEARVRFPYRVSAPIPERLLRAPAKEGKQSRAVAKIEILHSLANDKALGWFGFMVSHKEIGGDSDRTVACEFGYIKNKKGDCVVMRAWLLSGRVQVTEENIRKKSLDLKVFNLEGVV